MNSNFSAEERYSRQILFSGIGKDGQQKLAQRQVLILGCGGLGSAAAEMLARSGVGFLRLIDRDFVELHNLQRQSLYDEEDVKEGLPKAIAAQRKLEQINSDISIEAIVDDVNRFNIESLLKNIDLVLDATDNFQTRFLLNEACIKQHIPWIYGACVESYGLTMNIIPGKTPCFRCIFEKIPEPEFSPTCAMVGVINPIVNIIAAIQCAEALKMLTEHVDEMHRVLMSIDLWKNEIHQIEVAPEYQRKNCPVCQQGLFPFLSGKYGTNYTSLYGLNAIQILPFEKKELDLMALAIRLSQYGDPLVNEYLLRLPIDKYELVIFPTGRAVINGTTDTGIARAIYTKYIEN